MMTECKQHERIVIKGWQQLGGEPDWGSVSVCELCGEIHVVAAKGAEVVEIVFKAVSPEVLDAIAKGLYTDVE
jgi:hypothetical protein